MVAANAQTTTPLRLVDRLLTDTVSRDRMATAPLDVVMLHFCSDVLENPHDPFNVGRIVEIFTSYTVSAHYLIGRDGTVFRFVPEDRVAFHAGRGNLSWAPERRNRLNDWSIGIEMLSIGSAKDMALFMSPEKYAAYAEKHPDWIGYTDAQYQALQSLLKSIRSRHPAIRFDRKHIIGHDEYAGARRTDPGELFDWKRIGL
jgi:N-acetyl-anhydromuramyl-L-alanine amidase AmpD